MLKIFRTHIIPFFQTRSFKIFIFLFAFTQIVARMANWSEKAYKEDMKWERPPDRLPDIVDATIEMQNRDAKIQQVTREFDKMNRLYIQQKEKGIAEANPVNNLQTVRSETGIKELALSVFSMNGFLLSRYYKNIMKK